MAVKESKEDGVVEEGSLEMPLRSKKTTISNGGSEGNVVADWDS